MDTCFGGLTVALAMRHRFSGLSTNWLNCQNWEMSTPPTLNPYKAQFYPIQKTDGAVEWQDEWYNYRTILSRRDAACKEGQYDLLNGMLETLIPSAELSAD